MQRYITAFSLRIPEDLLNSIKYISSVNKRSTNKEIEYIIEEYIRDWEDRNGKISD
jgi:hypothetical protein